MLGLLPTGRMPVLPKLLAGTIYGSRGGPAVTLARLGTEATGFSPIVFDRIQVFGSNGVLVLVSSPNLNPGVGE